MNKLVRLLILFLGLSSAICAAAPADKLYDEDGDRIFEDLQRKLHKAGPGEQIPVIIKYKQKTPLAGTYAVRLNRVSSKQIRFTYRYLPAVAARLTKDQIAEVQRDPWVEHIELDGVMKATMDSARRSFGIDELKKQFKFTGNADGIQGNFSSNDVVIAVADTGVNSSHPDLKRKVLFWKDFVNGRARPYDDNGHGTLVAGVALGSGKGKPKFAGVAPQAGLVAFKVLDASGSGPISFGIAAIEEAIDRKQDFNIRVFNFSLAVAGSSAGNDSFSRICNEAVMRGIVVVVAAGNEGPASKTIGSPSAAVKVITVGAGADTGEKGFSLADFSSRGPTADGRVKPDIWGPGVRISGPSSRGGYVALSGTSFATPFVSGVVALMLQANPRLTPGAVKKILMATAVRWGPGNKNSDAGAGRIQPYEAVTRAAKITENLDPPNVPELFFEKGDIAVRTTKTFSIPVVSTEFPIAVTAISLNNEASALVLDLIDPQGKAVLSREPEGRQTTLSVLPKLTGEYRLDVTSISANINYLLDVSADMAP